MESNKSKLASLRKSSWVEENSTSDSKSVCCATEALPGYSPRQNSTTTNPETCSTDTVLKIDLASEDDLIAAEYPGIQVLERHLAEKIITCLNGRLKKGHTEMLLGWRDCEAQSLVMEEFGLESEHCLDSSSKRNFAGLLSSVESVVKDHFTRMNSK